MEMKTIYLHTGSNLGNRIENLSQAVNYTSQKIGKILKLSSIYETEPWGVSDQPLFYNQALKILTDLSPSALLNEILELEKIIGRIRKRKWGERIIDIDILFYESTIVNTPSLIIPHQYLHKRNFVLVPLMEIAPNLVHPIFKKTIQELYNSSNDTLVVKRVQ